MLCMQTTAKDEDLTASTPTLACRPYYSNYVNDYYSPNYVNPKPIAPDNSKNSMVSNQIAHNPEPMVSNQARHAEKQASTNCFIDCCPW